MGCLADGNVDFMAGTRLPLIDDISVNLEALRSDDAVRQF
jgi:hypothetical protein